MLEWVRGDNRLGAGDHYVPHFPVNKRASHPPTLYTLTLDNTNTDTLFYIREVPLYSNGWIFGKLSFGP